MSKVIYIKWQDILDELTATCNRSKFEIFFINQNYEGMVKHCLEDCNIRSLLETWMEHFGIQRDKTSKSVTKSNEYRSSGNNTFKIGNDIESLQLYSKSIYFAPKNNEAYSLGFANRSAVLFRLQHYEECLQDIDTALENNYPEHLRYKLLLRKGKIFLIKRQCQKAIKFLKEAESCMPANVQSFVRNDLLETLGAAIANSDLNIEENSINDLDLLPKLKNGENKELMYSSAALSLKESKEKGRHIIANVDIRKGDVLFVEKPVAFVVLPGSSESVCDHCCKPSHSLIPCEHCVSAVFCSHTCYTNAWQKYHQWECGGLELFYLVGIAHLGLRLTLVCSSTEQDERQDQVMNLMSHIEDLQLEDAYQYCLTASLLLLYLQKNTQYFSTVENSDSIYKVGGQIMHHICQLICNGHAITGFATTPGKNTNISFIENRDEVSVATAIFPTASMMNHSCDPNIINSFCNECLIVKAVRDISCGDEVFNCYGPYFRRMDSTERKEVLKRQYFFDCSCLPCQKLGNDDFLAKFSALLCFNCNGPLLPTDLSQGTCLNCGNLQPTEKLMLKADSAKQLFNQGLEKLKRNKPADACDLFKEALKIFAESLYRHNIKIRECRDLVAKCLVELRNFSEGGDSLLENLESIEQQYGPDSIEVANELLKYIDVAESEVLTSVNGENGISHISNERLKKMNHCIKRAINIYTVNCGVWSENYRSVLKTEETLKNYLPTHV